MEPPILLVVSEEDPVATAVAERWGTAAPTGDHVDGSPIRRLDAGRYLLRRPVLHVHDERLDLRLPVALTRQHPTLVFPSTHRSEQDVRCLTTHPLGNLGPRAEVGGRPRTLDPTDPVRMTSLLRRLAEDGAAEGWTATFESTHHGPELELPAFFAEVGFGSSRSPPTEAVRVLARALAAFVPDVGDRVAVGVGGGHYAPHFTQLALRRRWAFGHLVSRHALADLEGTTARAAWAQTPGAEGLLVARAQDLAHPAIAGLAGRLREGDAALRSAPNVRERTTRGAGPSGT